MLFLSKKSIDKIPDSRNAKEHYQSFIRKKNTKSAKQLEIITYQPKPFENPNIVLTKSVVTEFPKALHKLSKAEKVTFNSSLYRDKRKSEIILNKKKIKITKPAHAFKDHQSNSNFNLEVKPKDTEFSIKSKLKKSIV